MNNSQRHGVSSPFILIPKNSKHTAPAKNNPTSPSSGHTNALTQYNEWRDPETPSSHTTITTEMLMSRPFSTFRSLRQQPNTPQDEQMAPKKEDPWFLDDDANEPMIHWEGLKSIAGALITLLGSPLQGSHQGQASNLLNHRRRRLGSKPPAQNNNHSTTSPLYSQAPYPFMLKPAQCPTLKQYSHLYHRQLTPHSSASKQPHVS